MNIGLDATPLSVPAGGIRRYTEELSRALAAESTDDHFWLLSDQPFPCIAGGHSNLHCGQLPSSALDRRWWSIGLPREMARIDAHLFHGTDFAVPYRQTVPSVMTVHDLTPWRAITRNETAPRVRRRSAALLKLHRPSMLIAPTSAIRAELIERFTLDPAIVLAVPHAASEMFRPLPAPPPHRPYFLHVGAIQKRKNLDVILNAWRHLRRSQEVDLVLAGKVRDPASRPAAEPGLHILESESDDRLASLYSAATACFIPSHYEGFGLPALEAMQCGCPVIASRDPALMEVSGGAAEHVDATDDPAWRTAMEAVLTNPALRDSLRERGLARASNFSWRQTARLTREVYAEALRRFRR
jgi:glycosyltransferase involved in cell wall biosynthesis